MDHVPRDVARVIDDDIDARYLFAEPLQEARIAEVANKVLNTRTIEGERLRLHVSAICVAGWAKVVEPHLLRSTALHAELEKVHLEKSLEEE